jgi:hypothetical protein
VLGGITTLPRIGAFDKELVMEGTMAPKKSEKLCIMIDEEQKARLSAIAFACDITPSELVRSCIILALPVLESTPSLIQIVPTLPTSVNRGLAG